MKKAVCIMSGGMDSTLSAYIANQVDGFDIISLHFNYGQRTQKREQEAFLKLSKMLNVSNTYSLNLDIFAQIGGSALTDTTLSVPTGGLQSGIPITYVPFRNGIFLSIAAAVAEKEGASAIYIGVVEEDSSGYPDCTDDFINKMQEAINAGTKPSTKIELKTPLVKLKKEQIVQRSIELNVPLEHTWSCYQNSDKACGVCDSCRLRLKGFENAGVKDKIAYQ